MDCIYCGGSTAVVNSRPQKRYNAVWRRRTCLQCRAIFTTEERVAYTGSLIFVDSLGHVEPFSRPKLFSSIYEACKHRKSPADNAEALTATILARVLPASSDAKIERKAVVATASEVLKRYDKAAAVSYLAYHS